MVKRMATNTNRDFNELRIILEERSYDILEKFGQTITSGVTHPTLLSVLSDVKAYWKDMLRPTLASLCCEVVGGRPEMASDISLMITLVAAGMGLHDDVVDKSTKKHFRRTILGLYGTDSSLVAGDLLIVKALTAIRKILMKNIPIIKTANIIEVYENSFVKMCEGEFMEISCRKNVDNKLEFYEQVLWKFTADIEACTRLGAILGDGSNEEIQSLAKFGRHLGFISRLGSDLKDCLNLEGNLPQRLECESVPLPILFAAKSSAKAYSEINAMLRKPSVSSSDVGDLLKLCFDTEAFDYMLGKARETVLIGRRVLFSLKPSMARTVLNSIIDMHFADVERLCI
jgi:geranylgeranyl pyrophosphate synthase